MFNIVALFEFERAEALKEDRLTKSTTKVAQYHKSGGLSFVLFLSTFSIFLFYCTFLVTLVNTFHQDPLMFS